METSSRPIRLVALVSGLFVALLISWSSLTYTIPFFLITYYSKPTKPLASPAHIRTKERDLMRGVVFLITDQDDVVMPGCASSPPPPPFPSWRLSMRLAVVMTLRSALRAKYSDHRIALAAQALHYQP